ncbi:hypothetical protein BTO32_15020 [Marinobacter lutaoensis]|uniref:PRTRC system protein E n=1 Tax=Marinobacter lutaoensis TaxID=135739 RepID=A0A1V2DQ57_9GAMM|nr:hypothetical protein [Marinobacter lutaoensis]ONF42521.1 hypothetical protein BTO32_15020 [Marinobacter lutaoensis]
MNSTLLELVTPILNSKTAKVTMDISAGPTDDELQVVVKPVIGPVSDKAPEELKVLCAALGQHIKVTGEPGDIERLLAERVNEQAGKRHQWANRAAQLDAAIAAAAAKDANGSKKTTSTTSTKKTETSGALVETDTEDSPNENEAPSFDLDL